MLKTFIFQLIGSSMVIVVVAPDEKKATTYATQSAQLRLPEKATVAFHSVIELTTDGHCAVIEPQVVAG